MPSFDAFIPSEIAQRAEALGVKKAGNDGISTFILAVLAGAFIALGALFYIVTTTGLSKVAPFGIVRVLGGLAFCLGLILVVVAGAELFTGNNLIVMAWASKKIDLGQLLRNWTVVYFGNFVGALLTAALVLAAGIHELGGGAVGAHALRIAQAKLALRVDRAFFLGLLCNALVCLAVWLCLSARSTTDKILSILFPVSAFVAMGFEHSVANMFFVPLGIFIREFASPSVWSAVGAGPGSFDTLTFSGFVLDNLIPVTAGNIVGGSLLVGLVYWTIYLRGGVAGGPRGR